MRIVSILNYLDFDKSRAMSELNRELGWVPCAGKHYESIYTRWVQGYYLPKKFQIDKRYGHYFDLINSGLMERTAAISSLKEIDYQEKQRHEDEMLLRKKLSLSDDHLAEIVSARPASFREYRNSYVFVQFMRTTVNKLRPIGLYPR